MNKTDGKQGNKFLPHSTLEGRRLLRGGRGPVKVRRRNIPTKTIVSGE